MSQTIETIYFALAESYDAVPAEKRELYLARLALLLANAVGDADQVKQAIATAQKNLEIPHGS